MEEKDIDTMNKDRLEKLVLEDRECICTYCDEGFKLKIEHLVDGEFLTRVKCPNCGASRLLDNVLVPLPPEPLSKAGKIRTHAKRAILRGILCIAGSWVMTALGHLLVGLLMAPIGGFLLAYGFIRLVALETIEEMGLDRR